MADYGVWDGTDLSGSITTGAAGGGPTEGSNEDDDEVYGRIRFAGEGSPQFGQTIAFLDTSCSHSKHIYPVLLQPTTKTNNNKISTRFISVSINLTPTHYAKSTDRTHAIYRKKAAALHGDSSSRINDRRQ
jgi:hypothetical protein